MIDRIVVSPLILLFVLGLAGCDGLGDAATTTPDLGDKSIDAGAKQARSSLVERDLAFANAAAERGLAEAYRLFLAEDAVQLPDGDWPLRSRKLIYEQIQAATRDSDFSLRWEPEAAEVSASGELGYTWGRYWLELLDEEGEPVMVEGNYVNVWRKSSDDVWEVVVDISNQITADYVADAMIDGDAPVVETMIE